jgi:hypothetical protein
MSITTLSEKNTQQPAPKTPNRGTKNRSSARQTFSVTKQGNSQAIAVRSIKLYNQQLVRTIKYCSEFTMQYMHISSTLIRCNQFKTEALFEEYVSNVIAMQRKIVDANIAKYAPQVEAFELQGYDFSTIGDASIISVEIRRSYVTELVDLFLALDNLLTLINNIEKTATIDTTQLHKMIGNWVVIPRQITGRLSSLSSKLKKQFSLPVGRNTKPADVINVNFDAVLNFMNGLKNKPLENNDVRSAIEDAAAKVARPSQATTPTAPKPKQPVKVAAESVAAPSALDDW